MTRLSTNLSSTPSAEDVEALRGPLTGYCYRMLGAAQIARMITDNDAYAHDRMLPTEINGQVGIGRYRPDETGGRRAESIRPPRC